MKCNAVFFVALIVILFLFSCNKNNTAINFQCYVADTYLNNNTPTLANGAASTTYNAASVPPYFQLNMSGANNQSVSIIWYNIDSIAAVRSIIPRTYTIPAFPLPPLTVEAVYTSAFSAPSGTSTYYSQGARNLGGFVTITQNTGPGGFISGTYVFNAINQSAPYDTVYITNGSFTNVPVVSQ